MHLLLLAASLASCIAGIARGLLGEAQNLLLLGLADAPGLAFGLLSGLAGKAFLLHALQLGSAGGLPLGYSLLAGLREGEALGPALYGGRVIGV